jgi:peptidoglycan hydrolase-like protein with peptidoglycan-binding domain
MLDGLRNIFSGLTIAGTLATNSPSLAHHGTQAAKDDSLLLLQGLNQSLSPYHRERESYPALTEVIEQNLIFYQQQGSFSEIEAVTEFQILLVERFSARLGFSGIDGKFGPNTASEVKRFQESRGIPISQPIQIDQVTAKAMLESWPPVNALHPGTATIIDLLSGAIEISRSVENPLPILPIVKEVQTLLFFNGFELGPSHIDGKFGAKTEQALLAYQQSRMLDIKTPTTIDAATVFALIKNFPEVDIKAPEDILYLKDQTWFQAISSDLASCLLEYLVACGKERREAVMGILRRNEYHNLPPFAQEQIIQVALVALPEGNFGLASLLNRSLPDGRKVLLDCSSGGQTVLDSLHKVATGGLHIRFEVMRANILSSFIEKLNDSSTTTQGEHGTCVPASIQYYLLENLPGKAARLVEGLLGVKGEVNLPGGLTLKRAADSIYPDNSLQRSPLQRVFQAALMELGNGTDFDYSNRKDYHFVPDSDQKRPTGLTFSETFDLIENLTGERPAYFVNPESSPEELRKIVEEGVPRDSLMILQWRELLPGETSEIHGYHAVNYIYFDKEQKNVYYRNPWGALRQANGSQLDNPQRVVVDRQKGMEKMAAEEFFKRLRVITLIPNPTQRP